MTNHKSEDYKLTAVEYYLIENKSQEEVCKIFNCTPRSDRLLDFLQKFIMYYYKMGIYDNGNIFGIKLLKIDNILKVFKYIIK